MPPPSVESDHMRVNRDPSWGLGSQVRAALRTSSDPERVGTRRAQACRREEEGTFTRKMGLSNQVLMAAAASTWRSSRRSAIRDLGPTAERPGVDCAWPA